jgi:ATP-dependent protease ClpP protease subunit
VQYTYTQTPNAKIPIMLVDKYIGKDASGKMHLDGGQFARELIALRDAGKTNVEVWINSKGGNVSEGMSMYAAMKASGLYIKTVNQGVVDSTAGWVFQAGNEREWMGHGLGLVHEAINAQGESVEPVNESVATMLASKSKLTPQQVRSLMKQDTIINATKAVEYGFCDKVTNSSDKSIYSITNSSDITEVLNAGNNIIKSKIANMEVNKLLGLSNEASTEAQAQAINSIIEARNAAEQKVTVAESRVTALTETLNAANTELTEVKNKLTEIENANRVSAAKALVSPHVGVRISDKPEVVAQWEKMAMADHDGTKELLESLNVNRQAPAAQAKPADISTGAKTVNSVAAYLTSAPVRK